MQYKCNACKDSGFADLPDGTTHAQIVAKEGKRPAWVGLLARTHFDPCPQCKATAPPAAPSAVDPTSDPQPGEGKDDHHDPMAFAKGSIESPEAATKKRKYTKRSPRWGKKRRRLDTLLKSEGKDV